MLQPVSPNSGECLGKRASAFFAVSCFGFGVPVPVAWLLCLDAERQRQYWPIPCMGVSVCWLQASVLYSGSLRQENDESTDCFDGTCHDPRDRSELSRSQD